MAPTAKPTNYVYGYIRCSHADSAESGLGLEAQRQTVRAYFDLMRQRPEYSGVTLRWGGYFQDDAVSAFRFGLISRPQGMAMNMKLQPGDHVVFLRFERSFRQQADFCNTYAIWAPRQITMHSATEMLDLGTASGMAFAQILTTFAQLDSARKGERTREAVAIADARRRANGQPVSRTPQLGYKRSGSGANRVFVPDRKLWPVMRLIAFLRDKYGWGWLQISDHIEKLLAKKQGRKPVTSQADKRQWDRWRCRMAYDRFKGIPRKDRRIPRTDSAA